MSAILFLHYVLVVNECIVALYVALHTLITSRLEEAQSREYVLLFSKDSKGSF